MTEQQKISEILKRREYFDSYFPALEGSEARKDFSPKLPNSCPSCGYLTLESRWCWDTCSFCFWEDDGQDNHNADTVLGGPNSTYSLTAYRLKMYDWMEDLKNNPKNDHTIESLISQELLKLDKLIENKEENRKLVLDQIESLTRSFDKLRQIEAYEKMNWNFLTDEETE